MKFLIFTVACIVTLAPTVLLAQQVAPGGFVTCEGTTCGSCDVVNLANTLIKFFFGLVGMIFAVMMMIAGFEMVTSGGNTGAVTEAKSKFQNLVIGLIIVMAAWLMVDTVMKGLLVGGTGNIKGWGPWATVQCTEQTNPQGAAAPEGNTEYSYTAYTYNATDSCNVQHTRYFYGPDLCVSDLASFRASVPAGNFYLETTCFNTPSGEAIPVVMSTAPVCGGSGDICSDDAALMAEHNGSPIGLNDPQLAVLIQCYRNDPAINALTDASQLYTDDRSSPRCSLTNGNEVCGLNCSHSANSMHYGRGSGRGARAVDFNASPSSRERDLYDLIVARRSVCGGTVLFETDHTHISL